MSLKRVYSNNKSAEFVENKNTTMIYCYDETGIEFPNKKLNVGENARFLGSWEKSLYDERRRNMLVIAPFKSFRKMKQ